MLYIDRIDFERVGRWTKRTVVFGPGLNLVFGGNETGKSTARRAIEALLFAPEGKDVASLAELTAPLAPSSFDATAYLRRGEETITWRRKGARVLLPDGRPLSDVARDSWLWGAKLVDFRALYSLDGDALRSERFLSRKERGSFGALLLELETGGRDLGAIRAELQTALAQLYVKRGRSQALLKSLEGLKEQVLARRQIEALAGYEPYARALDERNAAREALGHARTRRAERQREVAELNQLLSAPPRLEALDGDERELAELALVQSRMSREDCDAYAALEHRIRAGRDQRKSALLTLDEAQQACDGRQPSAPVYARGKEIAAILGRRASIEGYDGARTPLEVKRDGAIAELVDLLREVGTNATREWVLVNVDELVFPSGAAKRPRRPGALREACELYVESRTALVEARGAHREAELELSAAAAAVADIGPELDVDELDVAMKEGSLAKEARSLATERSSLDAERQAAERLAIRLGFTKPIDLEACARVRVPNAGAASAVVQAWADAQRELTNADIDVERSRNELSTAERKLRAAEAAAPRGVSRDALDALRAERDAAIEACTAAAAEGKARIERRLEKLSAVERRLDTTVDAMLAHAHAVEAIELARKNVDDRKAALTTARESHERCVQASAAVEARWTKMWSAAALSPPSLHSHDAWRRDHEALLERVDALMAAEAEHLARQSALDARRNRLAPIAGIDTKAAIADATTDAALDKECKRRRTHNTGRERILARQREAREALVVAAEQLRLAEETLGSSTAAFLEQFDRDVPAFVARDLDVALRWAGAEAQVRDKGLRTRDAAQALEDLGRAYAQDVTMLQATIEKLVAAGVSALAPVLRAASTEQLSALARVQEQAKETAVLEAAVREADRGLARTEEELASASKAWEAQTSAVALGAPSEPCSEESRAFLSRANEMVALEDVIAKQRAALGSTVEALRERVAGRSTADIQADIDTQNVALAAFEEGDLAAAEDRVKVAEEKVAEIEGTTTLAALSQQIEAAVAKLLPELDEILALQGALEILTEAERLAEGRQMIATILETASRYLAQLTRGSLVAVEIDDEHAVEDRAHLAVVRADSSASRLTLKQLSDGARDQLWLALRLAFLQHHLGQKRLPVVLDDVLVHFDEHRSKEALLAIAELARHTQVIVFTHHAWLLELAREAGIEFHGIELEEVVVDDAPEPIERIEIEATKPAFRSAPAEASGCPPTSETSVEDDDELAERILGVLAESGATPLGRAEIVSRIGSANADRFGHVVKRLKEERRVLQMGAKRAARYVLADSAQAVAE